MVNFDTELYEALSSSLLNLSTVVVSCAYYVEVDLSSFSRASSLYVAFRGGSVITKHIDMPIRSSLTQYFTLRCT